MPREIDLREVQWLTITPENYEEQFAIIEAQEGELVFLAMTIPDYETMAYNGIQYARVKKIYYRTQRCRSVLPKGHDSGFK